MPRGAQPDPVSVRFEAAAERTLIRAYQRKGAWFATRITDPTPLHIERWAGFGINVRGRDTAAGRKARTRWARAFVRALERANKANGARPIEWEVGRHVPASPGGGRPAGQAFRVRVRRGGAAAERAVRRKPVSQRIYDDQGNPGGRFADPALRDW